MRTRPIRKKILLETWRRCLQTSGIYRFLPSQAIANRRSGSRSAPPGLAPESALRLHPCRALPSAPVSTSVEEKVFLAKVVVVVDREE